MDILDKNVKGLIVQEDPPEEEEGSKSEEQTDDSDAEDDAWELTRSYYDKYLYIN